MNCLHIASFLCMAVVVSASGWSYDDGSWKGEGLAESQDKGSWSDGGPTPWGPAKYAPVYKYEPAPLGHDGRVIDTADVAHAKAAHFAALEAAHAAAPADKAWAPEPASWGPAPAKWGPAPAEWAPAPKAWDDGLRYHGPQAHIELTHDGKNLKDTPEVAHAKAEHLAAVAAASHKSYGPGPYHPW